MEFAENFAHNPGLPAWTRVGFSAWERMNAKGVAEYAPGELAGMAAAAITTRGELKPITNVARAIRDAIANDMIAPGSTATRLIVHPQVASKRRWTY